MYNLTHWKNNLSILGVEFEVKHYGDKMILKPHGDWSFDPQNCRAKEEVLFLRKNYQILMQKYLITLLGILKDL